MSRATCCTLFFVLLSLLVLAPACGPKNPADPDDPPWVQKPRAPEPTAETRDDSGVVRWEEAMATPPWRKPWISPQLQRPERARMMFQMQIEYLETWPDGLTGTVRVIDDRGKPVWRTDVDLAAMVERRMAAVEGEFCAFPGRGYYIRYDAERGREPTYLRMNVRYERPEPILARILERGTTGSGRGVFKLDRGSQDGVVRGVHARYGRKTLLVTRVGDHECEACEVPEAELRESTRVPVGQVFIERCPESVVTDPGRACRDGLRKPLTFD